METQDQKIEAVMRNHEAFKHLVIHVKDMHKRENKGAIYCGRDMRTLKGSIFGNPFIVRDPHTEIKRLNACVNHRDYMIKRINNDPMYKQELIKLAGKTLACWCGPDKLCHCSTLSAAAFYLNSLIEEQSNVT